jgi:hypothetical protein
VEQDAEFIALPPVNQEPDLAGDSTADGLPDGKLKLPATPANPTEEPEPPKPELVMDPNAPDLSPDLKKVLIKMPKKKLEPLPEPPAVVMEGGVPKVEAVNPFLI